MTNYDVLALLQKETLAEIIGRFWKITGKPCCSCPCKGYFECNIDCKMAWLHWLQEEAISFSDISDDVEKGFEKELEQEAEE